MSKITLEIDEAELMDAVAHIIADRIIHKDPVRARGIATYARREAQNMLTQFIYDEAKSTVVSSTKTGS